MEVKQKPKLLKKVDLIILLSILAIAIITTSRIVVAQYGRQAEGEDAEIYIEPQPGDVKYETILVRASEDSYVSSSYPNQWHGSQDSLQVSYPSYPYNSIMKIWLKFSLGSISTSLNFTDIELSLYTAGEASGTPTINAYFSKHDNLWRETTITWNLQPPYEEEIIDSVTLPMVSGTNRQYLWNVTDIVLTELDGDKTITFVLETSTDDTFANFRSLEYGFYRPTLYITHVSYLPSLPSGLAFQPGITTFLAVYSMEGYLNSTQNEFFINNNGAGKFKFTSNEDFTLRVLKSKDLSATIQGDQGSRSREIKGDYYGLSDDYPVNTGNIVIIVWRIPLNYPLALPIIAFWGFIGGSIIAPISLAGAIKKRNLKLLWITLAAALTAFICFLILINP